MILVYTGNGKGKTSASVGQAVRALGQDMRVGFFQYMKRDGVAGEQTVLRNLLGDDYCAGGIGFLCDPEQFPAHREAALKLTDRAIKRIPYLDLLVLDEALYALDAGILTQAELQEIIVLCEKHKTNLVVSGRNAPDWLCDVAHLVTEMGEVKHPYAQGIPAARSLEF